MNKERITYYMYFLEHNIKIPIIQRDYAQGRDTLKAQNVRKNLLKAIKEALDENKILDLNFVYGTEKKME